MNYHIPKLKYEVCNAEHDTCTVVEAYNAEHARFLAATRSKIFMSPDCTVEVVL